MSAVERYVDDSTITGLTRYAKAYSGSGYFKDAASVEKAFVVISAGAEIGIAPFAAITGIALIQGKPVIGAGILAGLVKSHPKYDYLVDTLTDNACAISFYEGEKKLGTSTFTMDDAKRANLAGKDVWKNYPRNMLFARAISNGVAFYTPDVTTTRVYVEGELDDIPAPRPIASPRQQPEPDEEVVEAEIVPDAPVAHATAEASAPPVVEPASGTERVKAMLASLTPDERAAVKEACATLTIKPTPRGILDAFDEHAFEHDSFLVAISNAIKAHAQDERETQEQIAEARTAEARTAEATPETRLTAAEFEAARDGLASEHERIGQAQLQAAGNYGK